MLEGMLNLAIAKLLVGAKESDETPESEAETGVEIPIVWNGEPPRYPWEDEEPVLFYDLTSAADVGERRRPAEVLLALGIEWGVWEAQPVADQIKLSGCSNVPDELPTFIRKAGDCG